MSKDDTILLINVLYLMGQCRSCWNFDL